MSFELDPDSRIPPPSLHQEIAHCGHVGKIDGSEGENGRTDELIDGVDDLRVGLDLEESVLGHAEDEEMPLVRVKLGDHLLLGVVALHELEDGGMR